jgi:hypothetical protein
MFKSVLFVLLGFAFNSSAFADVTLQLSPASPMLMTSDFKMDAGNGNVQEIKAPWFSANLMILNSGTDIVSLTSQTLTISNPAGFSNTVTQPVNIAIAAGTGVQLQGYYSLAGLTDADTYSFSMTVNGLHADGTAFSATNNFNLTK